MKKVFLIILFIIGICGPVFSEENNLKSERGIVRAIEYVDVQNQIDSSKAQTKQIVTVELLSGEFKGQKVLIDNMLTNNPYYDILLKKSDKVVLHAELDGDIVDYYIADVQRTDFLYVLVGLFFALLLLIGRKKGFYSLVSILVTVSLILFVMAPMVLSDISPIFSAVIVCVLSSAVTIYLVGGFNYKSTSAVLGAVLTLILAGFLSSSSILLLKLTGFSSEECIFLFSAHSNLNFVGVLTASMMLATLGAVMDTAMSIASSVNEFFEIDNELTFKNLFKSGMNVGKDIIGTMANTLILVYLGSSLPLVLLSQNIDLQKFFNLNQVVTEISSALIGSISIVLCVPITALLTAYFVRFNKNKFDDIIIENNKD